MLNTFAKFYLQLCYNIELVIVNLSVTATCALYHCGLETEHCHGHVVETQVTQLLTWNFERERH